MTFEILECEGQKCEEVDFLVGHVLYALLFITGNNTKNIDMTKISATFKWNKFEVVVFELLDFEGSESEEVDYFSTLCALCPSVHEWEWTKEYWYIYLFIYLFVRWRAIEDQIYTIIEFKIYKYVLVQQDLEGREHFI